MKHRLLAAFVVLIITAAIPAAAKTVIEKTNYEKAALVETGSEKVHESIDGLKAGDVAKVHVMLEVGALFSDQDSVLVRIYYTNFSRVTIQGVTADVVFKTAEGKKIAEYTFKEIFPYTIESLNEQQTNHFLRYSEKSEYPGWDMLFRYAKYTKDMIIEATVTEVMFTDGKKIGK